MSRIKRFTHIPNKPAHRVWQVTRRKTLGRGDGAYDLADRKQFSKTTKAGRKRRVERANEIKKLRSQSKSSIFRSRGASTVGSRADESYSNIKKLYRGYGPTPKKTRHYS